MTRNSSSVEALQIPCPSKPSGCDTLGEAPACKQTGFELSLAHPPVGRQIVVVSRYTTMPLNAGPLLSCVSLLTMHAMLAIPINSQQPYTGGSSSSSSICSLWRSRGSARHFSMLLCYIQPQAPRKRSLIAKMLMQL